MLQSVMALAVLHYGDVVPTNPVRAVRKPSQARRDAPPIWPTVVEEIRARLPHCDATMISVLAYAGLRPEEMLALRWADVRPEHLVVERAVARGQLRGDELRSATIGSSTFSRRSRRISRSGGWRPAGPAIGRSCSHARGRPVEDTDWRNWRTRAWQPVSAAVGLAELERKVIRETVDGRRRRR